MEPSNTPAALSDWLPTANWKSDPYPGPAGILISEWECEFEGASIEAWVEDGAYNLRVEPAFGSGGETIAVLYGESFEDVVNQFTAEYTMVAP